MYPDAHFHGRKLVTLGVVSVTKMDTQPPRRLTFFSLSLLHGVGDQSLVDPRVASKPSQTYHEENHKPTNDSSWLYPPRVSYEPKSNKIYQWTQGVMKFGLVVL
jgi:hypothetical protein